MTSLLLLARMGHKEYPLKAFRPLLASANDTSDAEEPLVSADLFLLWSRKHNVIAVNYALLQESQSHAAANASAVFGRQDKLWCDFVPGKFCSIL